MLSIMSFHFYTMRWAMRAFILSIMFLFGASLYAEDGDKTWLVKEEFLSHGMENFDCHSSSIVETAPGKFSAVWKGGAGVGKSNIDFTENVGIWISQYDGKV